MDIAERNNFIEKLYRDYYKPIAALCTVMLDGDDSEGELCANEVFKQALSDADKLVNHPNIVGWLKVTAKNRVKRMLRDRSKKVKHEVHITDVSENYLGEYIEDFDNVFEDEHDLESDMQKVFSKLTQDELELYRLRFVQKLKYGEIAKRIGLSESASRIRCVRLELKIKQLVAELF